MTAEGTERKRGDGRSTCGLQVQGDIAGRRADSGATWHPRPLLKGASMSAWLGGVWRPVPVDTAHLLVINY